MKKSLVTRVSLVSMLAATLLLTGCQEPSVSEQEVNFKLRERLAEKEYEPVLREISGIRLSVKVDDLSIDLQSADGGTVKAAMKGTLNAIVPVLGRDLNLSAPFNPWVSGGLEYNEGKIYLTNPRVLDLGLRVSPPLRKYAEQLKTAFPNALSRIPVYSLDHNLKEQLAAKTIKGLRIEDDRLVFLL